MELDADLAFRSVVGACAALEHGSNGRAMHRRDGTVVGCRVPPLWPMVLRAARLPEAADAWTRCSLYDHEALNAIVLHDRRRLEVRSEDAFERLDTVKCIEHLRLVVDDRVPDRFVAQLTNLRTLEVGDDWAVPLDFMSRLCGVRASSTSEDSSDAAAGDESSFGDVVAPLTDLRLSGDVTETIVSGIARLRTLTSFTLIESKITGTLEPFARLGGLLHLTITGTRTLKSIDFVRGMPLLQTCHIASTGVNDVEALTACPFLTSLDTRGTTVTTCEAVFRHALNLRSVALNKEACLDGLEHHKTVTSLTLWDRQHAVSDVERIIPTLLGLESVSLGWTFVSSLNGYEALTRLRRADLRFTGIRDSDLHILAKLEQLEYINLSGDEISSVYPLGTLPRLKELELFDWAYQSVVEAGLTEGFVALKNLNLELNPLKSVAGLEALPALEEVIVSHTPLAKAPWLLAEQLQTDRIRVAIDYQPPNGLVYWSREEQSVAPAPVASGPRARGKRRGRRR